MRPLKIGGMEVDRCAALEHATLYLSGEGAWSYPSYDGFDERHSQGPLVDADLLAPVLLNVGRTYSIELYEALRAEVPRLQGVLDRIPLALSLADATDEHLEMLGELVSVLDGVGIKGARLTVLSKILHRKRPRFVPLYDRQVRDVYLGDDPFPIRREKGRSWQAFMVEYAAAVQRDLRREAPFWQEIADLAETPPITPLRALDIVAWWAGKSQPVDAVGSPG